MSRRITPKITFDTPPTLDELAEALAELRPMAGGDAVVRVMGRIEFNLDGPRVAAITVERSPEPA